MNKEDYKGYKAKGGILTQEYYCWLMESLENGYLKLLDEETDMLQCISTLAGYNQAKSIANNAEIELTEVEKQMYVFLRTIPLEENIEDAEKDGGFRPQELSDQFLMAEVLLITNNEEHGKFIGRWPNIFQV